MNRDTRARCLISCCFTRAFPAARLIVETVPLPEEEKAVLRGKLESALAPFKTDRATYGSKAGVILSGPFLEHSSFARINREIGARALCSRANSMRLSILGPILLSCRSTYHTEVPSTAGSFGRSTNLT